MPTYQVSISKGCLTADVKKRVAQAITHTHSAVTGADHFFAQVIFREVERGDLFLGGSEVEGSQLFVHGHIRARGEEIKKVLVRKLLDAVCVASALPARYVWVYVSELPPSLMVEFGKVLPEPGEEQAWKDALGAEDREYMSRTDFRRST